VHAPLVHAPGETVVLPLTVATDAKRRAFARLATLLGDATYVFARTMQNPHSYTARRTWSRDDDFVFAVECIRALGYRQKYAPGGYWETVLEVGSHFFWSGYLPISSTHWINRKPLPVGPAAEGLVDQTFVASDARLLPIPPLPDGFAGLPESFTTCRNFQWGVSMFGWPVADIRPRVRKKGR
jgi:hypothetical protein